MARKCTHSLEDPKANVVAANCGTHIAYLSLNRTDHLHPLRLGKTGVADVVSHGVHQRGGAQVGLIDQDIGTLAAAKRLDDAGGGAVVAQDQSDPRPGRLGRRSI